MQYKERAHQSFGGLVFFWLTVATLSTQWFMDKKTKKRIEILRQKVEKSQKLLADAKKQTDEPDEVTKIEQQIADYKSEIAELKSK